MTDEVTELGYLGAWEDTWAERNAAPNGDVPPGCRLQVRRSDGIGSLLHKEGVMRDRLEEERDLLRDLGSQGAPVHVVFIDSDNLFTGSIADTFVRSFDVGLPTRFSDSLPIVLSTKFVHGARLTAASNLWTEAINLWNEDCFSCDHVAFHRAIKKNAVDFDPSKFNEAVSSMASWDLVWEAPGGSPLNIMFMPCPKFSAVPGGSGWEKCKPVYDTRILHFKGKLKLSEAEYFDYIPLGQSFKAIRKAMDRAAKEQAKKKNKKAEQAHKDRQFLRNNPWRGKPWS